MKIICVGRNYVEHIKELENEVHDQPVVFLKPDSSLLKDGKDFVIPEWAEDLHYEAELVFKIAKNGKYIEPRFASKYVTAVTVGIDFTERQIQQKLKSKGLPWELSKSFDHSAVIGNFIPIEQFSNLKDIPFTMRLNGKEKQSANSSLMIYPVSEIISFVSRYFTLKTGDLIFTGTPKGVGKVKAGDQITGFINHEEVLRFKIR